MRQKNYNNLPLENQPANSEESSFLSKRRNKSIPLYWIFRTRGDLYVFGTAFLLILFDQCLKLTIKFNMDLGDRLTVFHDWFYLFFVENNGMAFGIEFGGDWGKLLLTTFRIVIVTFVIVYIRKIKKVYSKGFLISLGLIVGGAIGNIIDSVFYGLFFGYAPLLYGRVVDMFYFPLIDSYYPSWMPFVGGDHFIFFSPIFNLADAGISVGIFCILLFFRKELND